ncbi:stage II sporulation protein M [Brevibacillus fulvus]|uniref:Stage II sporulation protein M n=1 Tax=Brevibacillus fulvus TaxID=1125967 RepID=A0A938XXF5_9BACL|nr:stage II sporulation protein M [Brevibacillus fulvus]MBM7591982.1 stage II sporulation protein M [Brevibacillus fulvus]
MRYQLRQLWTDNKGYFYIAGLLLIGGAFFGFLQMGQVEQIAKNMLSQIQEIADRIQESGGSTAVTFWAIFKNNVFSSLTMMIFGLVFAIFPIFGLLSNGVLLGFIFGQLAAAGGNPLLVFAVGILPHGIFELPAVVFSAGIGIRYGATVLRSIKGLWNAGARGEIKEDWRQLVKQFPVAAISVIVVLFVAAIVESAITPLLIQSVVGGRIGLTE